MKQNHSYRTALPLILFTFAAFLGSAQAQTYEGSAWDWSNRNVGRFHAPLPTTSNVLWTGDLPWGPPTLSVGEDSPLYIYNQYQVTAVDRANGQTLWTKSTGRQAVVGWITVMPNHDCYLMEGTYNTTFNRWTYVLTVYNETGNKLWDFTFPVDFIVGGVRYWKGDVVYVSGYNNSPPGYGGTLYAFNLTGQKQWDFDLGLGLVWLSGIDHQGRLYVTLFDQNTLQGRLKVLNADRSHAWTKTYNQRVNWPTIDDSGTIYYGVDGNGIRIVNAQGSELRHLFQFRPFSSPTLAYNGSLVANEITTNPSTWKIFNFDAFGTVSWNQTVPDGVLGGTHDGVGNFLFWNNQGELIVRNWSWNFVWRVQLADPQAASYTYTLGENSVLYVATNRGKLHAIGAVTAPTPTPTLKPTSTPTGGPTFTPAGTPTFTPSPTVTGTPPTATPTPEPKATVWLGGYWDTRLTSASGGNMQLFALAPGAQQVEVYLASIPAGVVLPVFGNPADGIFWLTSFNIPADAGPLKAVLDFRAQQTGLESLPWPYLNVTD